MRVITTRMHAAVNTTVITMQTTTDAGAATIMNITTTTNAGADIIMGITMTTNAAAATNTATARRANARE